MHQEGRRYKDFFSRRRAGNVLTLTIPGVDTINFGYCVEGSTLHVSRTDPATGAVTNDLVATK